MKDAATKSLPTLLDVRFARKPYDLASALDQLDTADDVDPVMIQARCPLTPAGYDAFVADFSMGRDWLAGRGGFRNGHRMVVEVTASQRRTLYIDPSGSDYARYVGFADEA
jgi:hypothetical protein